MREFHSVTVGTITLNDVVARVGKGFPTSPGMGDERYNEGLNNNFDYFTIAINNVWGARANDNGSVSSYEKIGYHAGSIDFVRGILDSGCPAYCYCDDGWRRIIL